MGRGDEGKCSHGPGNGTVSNHVLLYVLRTSGVVCLDLYQHQKAMKERDAGMVLGTAP